MENAASSCCKIWKKMGGVSSCCKNWEKMGGLTLNVKIGKNWECPGSERMGFPGRERMDPRPGSFFTKKGMDNFPTHSFF